MSLAAHHNHPEIEEREHLKNYTPEDARRILEAAAIQADLGSRRVDGEAWGDGYFTRGSSISGTTWHRLKRGEYKSSKVSRLVRAIHDHARAIERRTRGSGANRAEGVAGFVETDAYKALGRGLEVCRKLAQDGNEDRLLMVVGKTGMGKSTLARQTLADVLAAERPAWLLHAMPSWSRSYHAFLGSLAREIGLPDAGASSPKLEGAVLAELGSRKEPVLFVEEVEDLGGMALSFLKSLLNQSACTVVLLMTPEFHAGLWRSPRGQARQLLRRQASLIPLGSVEEAMIRRLAPDLWQEADAETLRLVISDAETQGGYDYVTRVQQLARKAIATARQTPREALRTGREAARRQVAGG